jgi:hypothetical protein
MSNKRRNTEPTAEDCTARRQVLVYVDGTEVLGYACWYPQMGGYVGKCVVVPGGCFGAYVWHDGEFPFNDLHDGPPAHLHHCDPTQFIEFGQFVAGLPGMEREP